jgi:hypothetical protein
MRFFQYRLILFKLPTDREVVLIQIGLQENSNFFSPRVECAALGDASAAARGALAEITSAGEPNQTGIQ